MSSIIPISKGGLAIISAKLDLYIQNYGVAFYDSHTRRGRIENLAREFELDDALLSGNTIENTKFLLDQLKEMALGQGDIRTQMIKLTQIGESLTGIQILGSSRHRLHESMPNSMGCKYIRNNIISLCEAVSSTEEVNLLKSKVKIDSAFKDTVQFLIDAKVLSEDEILHFNNIVDSMPDRVLDYKKLVEDVVDVFANYFCQYADCSLTIVLKVQHGLDDLIGTINGDNFLDLCDAGDGLGSLSRSGTPESFDSESVVSFAASECEPVTRPRSGAFACFTEHQHVEILPNRPVEIFPDHFSAQ